MGTLVQFAASGADSAAVTQALDAAERAVAQVDALMSFHDEGSELTRINRLAHRVPQRVSAWTYAVLRRARRLSELSEGLFDVCVAPVLVRQGLLPRMGTVPSEQGNWRDLRLLAERYVSFSRPVLVDLGGIAKGFAVDVAIHALRQGGCTHGTVNAGGDLRRFGPRAETIYLRHGNELMPIAQLRCGALATSSPNGVEAPISDGPLGHIVEPRSGERWRGTGSVTVAARSCVAADALTKLAALAGPACQPLLDRFGAQAYWDSAAR